MEIGPDKTKVMTNNPNGFQREIKMKGQWLEEVENFMYLGAFISNEGSKPEIGFEGRIWDLIVSVPDHCLSFYFPG